MFPASKYGQGQKSKVRQEEETARTHTLVYAPDSTRTSTSTLHATLVLGLGQQCSASRNDYPGRGGTLDREGWGVAHEADDADAAHANAGAREHLVHCVAIGAKGCSDLGIPGAGRDADSIGVKLVAGACTIIVSK